MRRALPFLPRVDARRENDVEQITLAITIDPGEEPPIALGPEHRRRLVELMAAAIIAVHRTSAKAREENDDDDACE
jgi:hypothetical protein